MDGKKEIENNSDLIARLRAAQKTFMTFSELAVKSKKIKQARQFDIYAVAIREAIEVLK